MKWSFWFGLLATFALAACEIDEPPQRSVTTRAVSRYPAPEQSKYPPPPQPFTDPSQQSAPVTAPGPYEDTAIASAPAPAPQAAKGDYPYGVPVEGKPGFVRSPYSPDKMTDVRGYAPGTEVKDPYTGKIFLVP